MEVKRDGMEQLFVKYWDGSADVSEKIVLLDWLKQNDENRKVFSQSYDIWLSASLDMQNDLETAVALDRFKSRIADSEKDQRKNKKLIRYGWQIAASIMLVFLVGNYLMKNYSQIQQPMVINQVIMPEGNKGKVVLPDGSLVWLQSDTKIIYPENFSAETREVKVIGEAYFEVVHDKQKPFIVNTDNLSVKVLGTKFNMRNYPERENMAVTLLEGRVGITSSSLSSERILLPNQQFILNKKSRSSKLISVKAEASVSWIKDRLAFENKRLSEIIPYLEAWYGVDIVCDSAVSEQTHLTFTIRNESLNETMKSIQFVSALKFRQNSNKLFINK